MRYNPKSEIRNPKSKIGIILLAAGQARRFEYFPKQLLEFGGQTLLRRTAENALNSTADAVCVVLGANAEKLRSEIEDLPLSICFNEDWARGMASSLKKGLQKLLEIEPELAAVGVMLVDQPLITAEILNRLLNCFRTENPVLIASEYAATVGVPAVFSHRLFDELLNLESAEGAKKIILKHLAEVKKLAVPEADFDIDSPADYEKLRSEVRSQNRLRQRMV